MYSKKNKWNSQHNRIQNEDIRKASGVAILKTKWENTIYVGLVMSHAKFTRKCTMIGKLKLKKASIIRGKSKMIWITSEKLAFERAYDDA